MLTTRLSLLNSSKNRCHKKSIMIIFENYKAVMRKQILFIFTVLFAILGNVVMAENTECSGTSNVAVQGSFTSG